jgi:SAM-dependent methyltransferase
MSFTPVQADSAIESSAEDIQYVLKKARYHRFVLPDGTVTQGRDRSATAAAIFPPDLAGRSLLDIGCHHGFYCIEAKKRGAGRVVGVEGKPKALKVAHCIQRIYGYDDSELVEGFFPKVRLPLEQFDIVLLMNVVHHLGSVSKARAMILKALSLTRETLILGIRPSASEPGIDAEADQHSYTMEVVEVRVDPDTGRPTHEYWALLSRRCIREMLEPLVTKLRIIDALDYPGRFIALARK